MAFPASRPSPSPGCGQSRSLNTSGRGLEVWVAVGAGWPACLARALWRKATRPAPRTPKMQAET